MISRFTFSALLYDNCFIISAFLYDNCLIFSASGTTTIDSLAAPSCTTIVLFSAPSGTTTTYSPLAPCSGIKIVSESFSYVSLFTHNVRYNDPINFTKFPKISNVDGAKRLAIIRNYAPCANYSKPKRC